MKRAFYQETIAACQRAKKLLKSAECRDLMHKNEMIGAGGDRSSGLDLAMEKIFAEALAPYGRIESEESGCIGEGKQRIILDPLDGSSNALSRFPYYGVSIARIGEDGILSEALVCNLANGDLFLIDEQGHPLQGTLGCERFTPPAPPPFPEVGIFERAYAHPEIVSALDREGLKFRSPGAVALSLAYARNVNYMLFVGPFRIYDFAAGLALCKGLEVIVEEEYVLVAREREVAQKIETILLEARS